MYSFDGVHRQKPTVSLSGASRKENKSAFMEKKLIEREKRQTARSEIAASIQIQKFVRGCLCRKRQARQFRSSFDQIMMAIHDDDQDDVKQKISSLIRLIYFIYEPTKDYKRLVALCQKVLKLNTSEQFKEPTNHHKWVHHFRTLLRLCMRALETPKDPSVSITIPLRMLETFTDERRFPFMWTDANSSIMLSLVSNGYFKCLRTLINNRIPHSLEMSARPPTPLAATIKDLIMNPIKASSSSDPQNNSRDKILCSFAKELLCPEMTDQIFLYLVPAIAPEIPFSCLLDALLVSTPPNEVTANKNITGVSSYCAYQSLNVDSTPWLLYALLSFGKNQIENLNKEDLVKYLVTLKMLLPRLDSPRATILEHIANDSDSDSDVEMEATDIEETIASTKMAVLREQCLEMFDEKDHISQLVTLLGYTSANKNDDWDIRAKCIECFCHISYTLLTRQRMALHKTRLLRHLAFHHAFIRGCWHLLSNLTTKTPYGKDVLYLNQLSRGSMLSEKEKETIVPLLFVFCSLFKHSLFCVYDTDFYGADAGKNGSMMPFSLPELANMSRNLLDVVIGLIQMMFSDTRANVVDAYGKAMLSVGARPLGNSSGYDTWSSLCQAVTQLVKQLHSRDSRHKFCPEDHWLSPRIAINAEQVTIEGFFEDSDTKEETFKPGMSALTARSIAMLRHIPFSVPFLQRVQIFQRILNQDKQESQDIASDFMLPSQGLAISVNRKYLYQDAYDQLSLERAPNIKKKVRVKMVNAQGLDEAGIDGGGIFREFMSQLLKTGFDPSYGFFKVTSEQLLYPNPQAGKIVENCEKHFHFLGRMLGKAIYENMMIEMPFAPFFLCKLLNKHNADVDIHHLESLDPELYRNLLSLKNYDGDFEEIALNFTVVRSELGSVEVENLKPGGQDISVTSSNKIEYIHLMADYRLNKQIRSQCNAFRAGLSDVINIEWLQMFSHKELQVLISGAPVPVDLEDLRQNANYSGGYADDNEYIEAFWDILDDFNDNQRRQFLKFVTSCSRPPLLGFKELYPKLCIHFGGNEDRLPSASTCMNILKLPEYESKEILKARLLYAVESDAGFELS